MIASHDSDTEIVKLLLELGADPNLKNANGETALDWALNTSQQTRDTTEVIKLLKKWIT